jgi:hypothetical protein
MGQKWAQSIKEGRYASVIFIGCHPANVENPVPNAIDMALAGENGYDFAHLFALQRMTRHIHTTIDNQQNDSARELGPQYVFANMTRAPASFDFFPWLIHKEMCRVAAGAPAPLKVGFFFGKNNDKDDALGEGGRRRKQFDNIILPMLRLVGAVEDETALLGQTDDTHAWGPAIALYKKGQKFPELQTPITVESKIPPVVITLREAGHVEHRNSVIGVWIDFAKYLADRGERVLFVRDTAKADEAIPGWPTCPEASKDLLYRVALYKSAKCNIFTSNGPATLAWMLPNPWILFQQLNNSSDYQPEWEAGWRRFVGTEPYKQLPWATENQRIVWERPKLENMIQAWEDLKL